MPIKLKSTGGGDVTLDVPSTASTYTLTAPARTGNIITSADSGTITQGMIASGVAGNGPAFSAYLSATQSISANTFTKVNINAETFDTNNCFNTSTYTFTPNVAGYYQLNGCVNAGASSSSSRVFSAIYKNGIQILQGNDITFSNGASGISGIVYMNGTTDYVELYGYINGTSTAFLSTALYTYFHGALVRAA